MDRKCVFELYPDRVRAVGRVATGKFETTIALGTLDPNFERLWVFSTLFYSGVFMCLIGFVGLAVVLIGINHGKFDTLAGGIGAFALLGIVQGLICGRKIELVRFRSHAGVPMLAIARVRKLSGDFDAFVAAIVEQIASA
jgi:hypothetical protein